MPRTTIDNITDDLLCGSCNGSGEGMYDGSTCCHCGGSGEERDYEAEYDDECARGDYKRDLAKDDRFIDDDLPF